ncbi:Uncharacterised protein [uncultured archaeon]|nr:Uncharacterised protein [uncultured archaeon]
MRVRKVFTPKDIALHIKDKYGREASLRTLTSLARQITGKRARGSMFTPKEAAAVMKAIKPKLSNMYLSEEKEKEAKQHLFLNQKLPAHERLTYGEIAEAITPRAPISRGLMKKIGGEVRLERVRSGKTFLRATSKTSGHLVSIPAQVAAILERNPKIPLDQLLAEVKLPTYKQLHNALHNIAGTTLAAERKKALVAKIHKMDAKTGHALSTDELAKRLQIKKSYVAAHRERRGRGSGVQVRINNIKITVLPWIVAISSHESLALSVPAIVALSGEKSVQHVLRALSELKRAHLIEEIQNHSGSRYIATARGAGEINKNGFSAAQRQEHLDATGAQKLREARARLFAAKEAGVPISPQIFEKITEIISQKNGTSAARALAR